MKVLAVIGSPRLGNSYQIGTLMEKCFGRYRDVEFEYLFLKDVNLGQCRGCFKCVAEGKDCCPMNDDRNLIEGKLLNADGIILISPVYVLQVTGLMKNFIDRFAYLTHRPDCLDKYAVAVVTTGGGGMKEALRYLGTVVQLWGCSLVKKIGIRMAPWQHELHWCEKETEKLIAKAVDDLYYSIKFKKENRPSLRNVVAFRVFKTLAVLMKDRLPAEYRYYRNKRCYHYEGRISVIFNLIGWFAARQAARRAREFRM